MPPKPKQNNAFPDDIIEKEDFDDPSDEETTEEEEEIEVPEEEQKEEDDDLLANDDYGDEDQKDNVDVEEVEEGEAGEEDGGCLYRFAKKNMSDSEDENIDEEEGVFEDDIDNKTDGQIVPNNERQTKPILFKYERVRIKGDRAKQLSLGAKPMLLNVEGMNPKEIADLELERGVLPFIIERVLPDNRRERWRINELKIVN